jgi:catechol-2,3-dioxygenase
MQQEIENTLEALEQGRLTRREALTRLTALTALLAGASSLPRAQDGDDSSSTFRAVGLNHIALDVTDIPRSRDFYSEHLGLSVMSQSSSSCFMRCGEQFLAMFRSSQAGMNHYCYGIENYSVRSAAEKLAAKGLDSRTSGNRIYFDDPDGLEVQVSAMDHMG